MEPFEHWKDLSLQSKYSYLQTSLSLNYHLSARLKSSLFSQMMQFITQCFFLECYILNRVSTAGSVDQRVIPASAMT